MKPNSKTNIEQLAEWIDQWQEQLFRYAFYRVGSRSDAEDIVQDAFLKIFSVQGSIANPKAYLYRIVSNGCVDLLRHKSKLTPLEERMPTPPQSETTEAEEEFRRINNLLKELPEQQSEVIRLHIYGQMKFTEIAEMMDISASTIKSRFSSGIERLRQLFIN